MWPEFNLTSPFIMKKCQHMPVGNLQEIKTEFELYVGRLFYLIHNQKLLSRTIEQHFSL